MKCCRASRPVSGPEPPAPPPLSPGVGSQSRPRRAGRVRARPARLPAPAHASAWYPRRPPRLCDVSLRSENGAHVARGLDRARQPQAPATPGTGQHVDVERVTRPVTRGKRGTRGRPEEVLTSLLSAILPAVSWDGQDAIHDTSADQFTNGHRGGGHSGTGDQPREGSTRPVPEKVCRRPRGFPLA